MRIRLENIAARRTHVFGSADYGRYFLSTIRLARAVRPDVIYASDRIAPGPALAAQKLTGAMLLYHEHDSPNAGAPMMFLNRLREMILQRADIVIFPNAERAEIARKEHHVDARKIRLVWNASRRSEVPPFVSKGDAPITLYFHGSITPERLPLAVVEAVRRFEGRVNMRVAGYEAPGASGYLAALQDRARLPENKSAFDYLGQIPHREDLLKAAAGAHVGLSLMPARSDDINMRCMVGASNKPFDYMAAGLALLVSDLPDWRDVFVESGYGLACKPDDVGSIAAALRWFLDHPAEREAMGARGRRKIETDWNYETMFAPVLAEMESRCR